MSTSLCSCLLHNCHWVWNLTSPTKLPFTDEHLPALKAIISCPFHFFYSISDDSIEVNLHYSSHLSPTFFPWLLFNLGPRQVTGNTRNEQVCNRLSVQLHHHVSWVVVYQISTFTAQWALSWACQQWTMRNTISFSLVSSGKAQVLTDVYIVLMSLTPVTWDELRLSGQEK